MTFSETNVSDMMLTLMEALGKQAETIRAQADQIVELAKLCKG